MGVTLEELYCGATKEFELERDDLCDKCDGTGSKSKRDTTCPDCGGRGYVLQRRMIGPGMVQQMQVPCQTCGQTGKVFAERDRCPKCNGSGVMKVEKKFKVRIQPGMQNGEQIPFQRAGSRTPDIQIPGDVIFVLELEDHDQYQVSWPDLTIKKNITLAEALTGFQFEHTHLDGRKLMVRSPPGRVITPGKKLVLTGQGMQGRRQGQEVGDLIFEFDLTFPRMLDDDQIERLQKALPAARRSPGAAKGAEEVFMDDYTPEDWKRLGAYGEEEEDDDEEAGGGGIQCAHQ